MNSSTSLKNLLRSYFLILAVAAVLFFGPATPSFAQYGEWIANDGGGAGTGTGDFFDPNNWHNGVLPIGDNRAPAIYGGGTAVITAAGTGAYPGVDIEALSIGDNPFDTGPNQSGALRMDSGSMTVYDAASTYLGADPGSSGTLIMNGGYLEFGDVDGDGPASGGANAINFALTPGSSGRLEMHNDAVMRSNSGWQFANGSSTDVAPGSPGLAQVTVIMDGTSEVSMAGGITQRGANSYITLSDSAQITLGNSHGPGDPSGNYEVQNGHFNVGARYGATADIVVENNAIFNLDALYNEKSEMTLTVRDNGQFNIFNTATGGTETDFGMQSYLSRESNSNFGQSSSIVTLEGSGKFTVNSRAQTFSVPGNKDHVYPNGHAGLIPTDGLILSGGDLYTITHCGAACNGRYNGGIALVEVTDSAELSIVQTLWMTMANNSNASSTLKITGPDATVSIGDLVMAESIDQQVIGGPNGSVEFGDPLYIPRNGTATLHSVITGSSHTTIQVTDEARIGNGELTIELDGYSPVAGDSYTLLQTGNANGRNGEFKAVDLSLAPLSDGLTWELVYNADSVILNVLGDTVALTGDYNGNGVIDAADYAVWREALGGTTLLNDPTPGTVDTSDFTYWKANFGASQLNAGVTVPEPASLGLFLFAALGCITSRRR